MITVYCCISRSLLKLMYMNELVFKKFNETQTISFYPVMLNSLVYDFVIIKPDLCLLL